MSAAIVVAAVSAFVILSSSGSATLEDVQIRPLAELEAALGESDRLEDFEQALQTMYAALPKNEYGRLAPVTMGYALHRFFLQRHGWVFKDLDPLKGGDNSAASILEDYIPSHVQTLLKHQLDVYGLDLHELAVLAATIDHEVSAVAMKRIRSSLKANGIMPTTKMSVEQVDQVLDTYMGSWVLGEDVADVKAETLKDIKEGIADSFGSWNKTVDHMRRVRANVTQMIAQSSQGEATTTFGLSVLMEVVRRMNEEFGAIQDQECRDLKSELVAFDDKGTGRVSMSDFYRPVAKGDYHFEESIEYLRLAGVLDESNPGKPRVMIANYINSRSNCIGPPGFYSVCCMNECEAMLMHLESEVAAPSADPRAVLAIVEQFTSSWTSATRNMSEALRSSLTDIATQHAGLVPLHSRLFSQWMHHAFPRQCPYPHLSGAATPMTPDEFRKQKGKTGYVEDSDLKKYASENPSVLEAQKPSFAQAFAQEGSMLWSPEEELLGGSPLGSSETATSRMSLRGTVLAVTLVLASGLWRHSRKTEVEVEEPIVGKWDL